MDGIREFFSKRVLGIPVGVFALLFAGSLLFYAIRMPKTATAVAAPDTEADTDELAGDVAGLDNPVFAATPTIYQPSGPSVTATPQADTNELWGRRVQEWLVSQGASVDVAQSVVYKYLSGVSLTATEVTWRDKAVKQYGFPPETVDVVAPTPTPPTANPVYNGPAVSQGKPPLVHTVKGNSDNQASELARLYWGSNSPDAVRKMRANNTTLVEPYATGTKVKISQTFTPVYFKATAATHTLYDIARKNGTTAPAVTALNPNMHFPVAAGARVRVK